MSVKRSASLDMPRQSPFQARQLYLGLRCGRTRFQGGQGSVGGCDQPAVLFAARERGRSLVSMNDGRAEHLNGVCQRT